MTIEAGAVLTLDGWVYDTESSKRCSAVMELLGDGRGVVRISVSPEAERVAHFLFKDCLVSDRVGRTPRFISHAEFGRFETLDNNAVDVSVRNLSASGYDGQGFVGRVAHGLESNLKAVVFTLLVTVACVFGFVRYGLPWGAHQLALVMPESVVSSIGEGTLDILDAAMFDASALDEKTQEEWRARLLAPLSDQERAQVRIKFRSSEQIGANAFALPDGTVLFTDDMLAMAEADEELQAILFHEIGHVEARHSLRRLIQQSGIGLIVLLVSGDVNAASQAAILLPTMLVDAHYSREMEREADAYARARMLDSGIPLAHFVNIMQRIEHEVALMDDDQDLDNGHDSDAHNAPASMIGGFLRSHPYSEERIRQFEQAQQ